MRQRLTWAEGFGSLPVFFGGGHKKMKQNASPENRNIVLAFDDFKGEYQVYRKPETSRMCYTNSEKEDIAIESMEPGNTLESTAMKYGVSVANVKAWVRNYERDEEIRKRGELRGKKPKVLPGKKVFPIPAQDNTGGPNQKLVHTNLELMQKLKEKDEEIAFLNERIAELEKILEEIAEEDYERQLRMMKSKYDQDVRDLQAQLWLKHTELESFRKKHG